MILWNILFVLHVITIQVASEEYFEVDKSNWVQPGGSMFDDNQDETRSQSEIRSQSVTEDEMSISNVEPGSKLESNSDSKLECGLDSMKQEDPKVSILQEKLNSCLKEVKFLKSILGNKTCEFRAQASFKRMAFKAAAKIQKLILSSNLDRTLYLQFEISNKDISYMSESKLSKVSDENLVEAIDKIASKIIESSYLANKPSFLEANTEYIVAIILIIAVSYAFIIREGYFDKLILLIIVGTCWEWKRMYEETLAKKISSHANLSTHCHSNNPHSTFHSILNWFWSVSSWTVHAQSIESSSSNLGSSNSYMCSKYQESILVNPFLDVNPVEAFSQVITILIFRPLIQIAEYSGKATSKFFSHIPPMWIPVILPAALLITLVTIIVITMAAFRYSLSLPFVRIGPSRIQEAISSRLSLPRISNQTPNTCLCSRGDDVTDSRSPRQTFELPATPARERPKEKTKQDVKIIPRSQSVGDFSRFLNK